MGGTPMAEATQEDLQAGREYEGLFVPALFAPWTNHVLAAADVDEGAHVLDVACGSGVLARAALKRSGASGRVVGVDPAPGMIAVAREVEPNIEWVLSSAEDLPFGDGSFEYVVSQFGMMFFQDRCEAAREMHRVTRPAGRLASAMWHSVDRNPVYDEIVSILDEHVSSEAADAVRMPFCLGDPNPVAQLFSEAGFTNVAFESKSERAEFPSTRAMVEAELRGWLPLFDIHLSEEEIAEVLTQSEARLSKYATSCGKAVFSTSGYILTAQKPA